jgi:hypothetical protein
MAAISSLRAVVIAVALLAPLPTLGWSAWRLHQDADIERQRVARAVEATAMSVAILFHGQLTRAEAAVLSLRGSLALDTDDLDRITKVLHGATGESGLRLALIDANGRHLVDTLLPEGAAPASSDPKPWQPLFERGNIVVSDVLRVSADGRQWVAVGAPIARDGRIAWALVAMLSANDVAAPLRVLDMPPGWIVSIVDAQGAQLVRTRGGPAVAGQPLEPELLKPLRDGLGGARRIVALDGTPVIAAAQLAPQIEWAAAAMAPVAALDAPVAAAWRELVLVGGLVEAFALGLALFAAWRLRPASSPAAGP